MQMLGEISCKIIEQLRMKLDEQGERKTKCAAPPPYAGLKEGGPTSDLNKKPLEQTKGVDVSGLKHSGGLRRVEALNPTPLRRCKRIASPKQAIAPPVVVRLHLGK